jgi:hypothetical protein
MRPPAYIAEYSDDVRRIDGRWLFLQRKTTVIFVSRHALPLPGIIPPEDDAD